jgi:hypothetical protein
MKIKAWPKVTQTSHSERQNPDISAWDADLPSHAVIKPSIVSGTGGVTRGKPSTLPISEARDTGLGGMDARVA